MAKDKLVIEEARHGFQIGWFLAEDGEMGLILGPFDFLTLDDAMTVPEDQVENLLAVQAIHRLNQPDRDTTMGEWVWDSRASAQAALKVAKEAIKAGVSRPMPDWALKALEAGWKPPKGWKP